MKKGIIFFILLVFILTGCRTNTLNLSVQPFLNHIENGAEWLKKYNSPYTICYRDRNGAYNLFLFTAPVQFKDEEGNYQLIDNSLVQKNKNGKIYFTNKASDTISKFPDRLTKDTNINISKNGHDVEFYPVSNINFDKGKRIRAQNVFGNSVDMVKYTCKSSIIQVYPNNTGIQAEYFLDNLASKTLALDLTVSCSRYIIKPGYISFLDEDESIIANFNISMITNEKGQPIDLNPNITIEEKENQEFTVYIHLDQALQNQSSNIQVLASLNMASSNQPDSSVFSKLPYENVYKKDVCTVGASPDLGEGWQYVRFRFNTFFKLAPIDIINSTYYVKQLANVNKSEINLFQMDEEWSSTGVSWDTRINKGEKISKGNFNKKTGYLEFDITGYTKQAARDWSRIFESNGAVIQGGESSDTYAILATSDHALYVPFVKIILSDTPLEFYEVADTNK